MESFLSNHLISPGPRSPTVKHLESLGLKVTYDSLAKPIVTDEAGQGERGAAVADARLACHRLSASLCAPAHLFASLLFKFLKEKPDGINRFQRRGWPSAPRGLTLSLFPSLPPELGLKQGLGRLLARIEGTQLHRLFTAVLAATPESDILLHHTALCTEPNRLLLGEGPVTIVGEQINLLVLMTSTRRRCWLLLPMPCSFFFPFHWIHPRPPTLWCHSNPCCCPGYPQGKQATRWA